MGDKDKGEEVGWDGVFSFLVVLRWVCLAVCVSGLRADGDAWIW